MDREKESEKKFTEYLDRVLAGQEIPADLSLDEEMRGALDFARKLKALGEAPSAQFQARLKASLLQKLAEREAIIKEKVSFWETFRSRPAWQVAVAAAFVIVLVSVIWRAGFFQPSIFAPSATTTAPTTTTPSQAPSLPTLVNVTTRTDKAAYQTGETVRIELAMRNESGASLTVEKIPPVLSLMQAQTGQPVYTFAAGNDVKTLAPNEVVTFNYGWTETDFKGQPVTGSFYIELEDLEYKGQPVRLNTGALARFEILPQSTGEAGTRSIEVDRAISDKNITVTMQRLTISDTGIMVNAFITPPKDYVVTQSGTGYRANKNYSASAVYSLDGSWMREAGMSSVEYQPGGMKHTWFIPLAVPPDATELYFEITDIGGWTGSWRFTLPLK